MGGQKKPPFFYYQDKRAFFCVCAQDFRGFKYKVVLLQHSACGTLVGCAIMSCYLTIIIKEIP